jgi:hypothetical protein
MKRLGLYIVLACGMVRLGAMGFPKEALKNQNSTFMRDLSASVASNIVSVGCDMAKGALVGAYHAGCERINKPVNDCFKNLEQQNAWYSSACGYLADQEKRNKIIAGSALLGTGLYSACRIKNWITGSNVQHNPYARYQTESSISPVKVLAVIGVLSATYKLYDGYCGVRREISNVREELGQKIDAAAKQSAERDQKLMAEIQNLQEKVQSGTDISKDIQTLAKRTGLTVNLLYQMVVSGGKNLMTQIKNQNDKLNTIDTRTVSIARDVRALRDNQIGITSTNIPALRSQSNVPEPLFRDSSSSSLQLPFWKKQPESTYMLS